MQTAVGLVAGPQWVLTPTHRHTYLKKLAHGGCSHQHTDIHTSRSLHTNVARSFWPKVGSCLRLDGTQH